MIIDQLAWAAMAISNAPVQNTTQMRHKAAWMNQMAEYLDKKEQEQKTEKQPDPPSSI